MPRTSRRAVFLVATALIVAGIFPGALHAATGATAATTAVASPRISAPPDVLVGEADGQVDLVVSLSDAGTGTVTVHYATTNSSAGGNSICNGDFLPVSGNLTFDPGQTTKTVSVNIHDCADVEGFESFTLDLTTPVGGTIARASARVGIVDNDTVVDGPTLFVRDAVVDEKAGSIGIPVLMGGTGGQASAGIVTVDYATANAGATAGTDYTAASGTLTFLPGETVKTVYVDITDDTANEPAERFALNLSSATGGATILDAKGLVTIGASDASTAAAPRISAPPDVLVGEADGYVDLAVGLSAPSSGIVSVHYATTNTSAGANTLCNGDYVGAAGTITFAPRETTKVVRIDIHDCNDVEGLEAFTFDLSVPVGATIARSSARIGIVDNDPVVDSPALVIRDAVTDEKAGSVGIPVLLDGPGGQASAGVVTVHYATSNNGATAGSDYAATSGTLTFAPGETVKTVVVDITDDSAAEPAERIALKLSSPSGATIRDADGVVVIGASDGGAVAAPKISAPADTRVAEGDGYVDLAVSLSAPGTASVSVQYATTNGSAGANTLCYGDFLPASGTLTFAPGETTKVVRVDINDCNDIEGLETFSFGLSTPTGATITRASAVVSIVDNDTVGVNVYSYGISNDTYTVVALTDVIVENPGGGTDLVRTSLTYTLPTNLEKLTLTGTSARNGTGNSVANTLTGNNAANKLSGLGGNDTLVGGAGADTLIGGSGSDTITTGTGADIIVFDSLVGSDTVTDFNHTGDTFRISQAGIHIGDGDSVVDGAKSQSATGGFSKNAELVIITSNIVGDITAANAAAKIGSAATAYATGDDRLFVVDNGTKTGIYRFHSSGANATVSASELTLVARVQYDATTTSTSLSDYTFAP